MTKEKKLLLIGISVLILLIGLFISFLPIWGENEKDGFKSTSDVPRMEQDQSFSLEDMTNTINEDYSEEVDNINKKRGFLHLKNKIKNSETSEDHYSNEQDSLNLLMQQTIAELEAEKQKYQSQVPVSTPTVVPKEKTQAEKDAEYRAKLIEWKRQQDELKTINQGKYLEENSQVEFRAAIYRDQKILPGERVELLLLDPLTFQGNTYERNTFLYAIASIKESRVYLELKNINHIPINVTAYDLQDGMKGIYRMEAGELWREAQQEAKGNAVNNGINEISREVNIPIVGGVIRSVGNVFSRKKRVKKIPLFDDQEVIFKTM